MKRAKVKTCVNGTPSLKGVGGPTDDLNLRALSTGESVLPADTTQAIGGAPAVKALIDATHTPVPEPMGGRVPLAKMAGMADGGQVGYGNWAFGSGQSALDRMIEDQRKRLEQMRIDDEMKQIEERRQRVAEDQQRRMNNSNALSFAYRANGESYVRPLAARAKGMANGGGVWWDDQFARYNKALNPQFGERNQLGEKEGQPGDPARWTAVMPVGNPTLSTIGGFQDFAGRSILHGNGMGGSASARQMERTGPQLISKREQELLLQRRRATGGRLPKGELKDEEYYQLGPEERAKYWNDRYMKHGGVVGMANGGMVSLAQRAKERGMGMASGGSISYSMYGRLKPGGKTYWGEDEDYSQMIGALKPWQRRRVLLGGMADGGTVDDIPKDQRAYFDSLTPEKQKAWLASVAEAKAINAADLAKVTSPPKYTGAYYNGVYYANVPLEPTSPERLAGNAAELQARDTSIANARALEAAALADRLQAVAGSGPSGNAVYDEQMRQAAAQYKELTGNDFVAKTNAQGGYDMRPANVIAVEKAQFDRMNQQNAASSALDAQRASALTPQQLLEAQARGQYLDYKPPTPAATPAPVAGPAAAQRQVTPSLPSATAPGAAPARPGQVAPQAPMQRGGRVVSPMSLAARAQRRPLPVRGGVIGMESGGMVSRGYETEEEQRLRWEELARQEALARQAADYGPMEEYNPATGKGNAFAFRDFVRGGADPLEPQLPWPDQAGQAVTKQYSPGGTVITARADETGRVNQFFGTGSKDAGMDPASAAALAKVKDEYTASFHPQQARALADLAVAGRQRQAGEQAAQDAPLERQGLQEKVQGAKQMREQLAKTAPVALRELQQRVDAGEITLREAKEQAALRRAAIDDDLPKDVQDKALEKYRKLYIEKRSDQFKIAEETSIDEKTLQPTKTAYVVSGPDRAARVRDLVDGPKVSEPPIKPKGTIAKVGGKTYRSTGNGWEEVK